MASPSLLWSAAGRVLRRPSPQGPRVFFSGAAGRIGPCKVPCCLEGERVCSLEMLLGQIEAQLRVTGGLIDALKEDQERFERSEQLQKKISYALVPFTAAVCIFGPDKKEKSPAESSV